MKCAPGGGYKVATATELPFNWQSAGSGKVRQQPPLRPQGPRNQSQDSDSQLKSAHDWKHPDQWKKKFQRAKKRREVGPKVKCQAADHAGSEVWGLGSRVWVPGLQNLGPRQVVAANVARGVLSKLMMIIPTCTPFLCPYRKPEPRQSGGPKSTRLLVLSWVGLSWAWAEAEAEAEPCLQLATRRHRHRRRRRLRLVACIIIMRMRAVGHII